MAAWHDFNPWYAQGPVPTRGNPEAALSAIRLRAQLDEQKQVLPARLKAMELEFKERELNLATQLAHKEGMVEFGQVFHDISQLPDSWADPEADVKLGQLAIKRPYLVDSPIFQKTQEWIKSARAEKSRLLQLENQNLRLQGTIDHQDEMERIAQERLQFQKDKFEADPKPTAREQAANRWIDEQVNSELETGSITEDQVDDRRLYWHSQFGPAGQFIGSRSSADSRMAEDLERRIRSQEVRTARAEGMAKKLFKDKWQKDATYMAEKAALDILKAQKENPKNETPLTTDAGPAAPDAPKAQPSNRFKFTPGIGIHK